MRQIVPGIHIVDPGKRAKVTGVEIVEPTQDDGDISQENTDDSGVYIVVGNDAENQKPERKNKSFDDNLAEDIESGALDAIASFLLDGIDADLQSRKDWEDTANRAADYLGIKLMEPTTSVSADGTVCKSIATTMLEAALKLWGVARAELLPVGGPVKVRRDADAKVGSNAPKAPLQPGQPPVAPLPPPLPKPTSLMTRIADKLFGGVADAASDEAGGIAAPQEPDEMGMSSDDIAQALETDLNHFLTVTDREYYPDFSKMLFNRALIGNAFRKVYRCPLRRRPTSSWVKAQDLIVSNDCSHLSAAGRVTERIKMRQSIMRRLQVSGHYLDIGLVMPTGSANETEIAVGEVEGIDPTPQLPEDFEHEVYECYCELGSTARNSLIGDLSMLDKDENGKRVGYPLPYRVSIDRDSRAVLEIRRNWKQGDQDYRPRQRYVKYGFIPGLGFWDIGLIHIVGNPTQTATMIQRAMTDSTMYANFPGGIFLKGPGSRQMNTVIRPNPGEFVGMDAAGASKIQDVLMPVPYKPPGPEALNLVNKVEGDARRLAGVIELPMGEGRSGNVPVGTIMAYIESIAQVPGAVHKDDHISQQQEFELLRELFVEEPEALIAGNRRPARKWQIGAELADPELVPAADPNTPSQMHRLMKLQGMVAIGGMPQFQGIADNRKIYKKVMETLAGDDPSEYTLPEQPAQQAPPPPQVIAAKIRADSQAGSDQAKLELERERIAAKDRESQTEALTAHMDRQSEENRSDMTLKGKALETLAKTAGQDADRVTDHVQHGDKMGVEHRKIDSQAALAKQADSGAPTGGINPPTQGPGFSGNSGF